jgi:hypothetical protein
LTSDNISYFQHVQNLTWPEEREQQMGIHAHHHPDAAILSNSRIKGRLHDMILRKSGRAPIVLCA